MHLDHEPSAQGRWNPLRCCLFQFYVAAFHLAACFVATGPANVIIGFGMMMPFASALILLLTWNSDPAARRFAVLGLVTCIASYAAINFFRLGVFATGFYLPPFLFPVQVVAVYASLTSIDTQLMRYGIAAKEIRYGIPHLIVATTAFATAIFILQQLPLLNGLSFAWISYSVFAINFVLVSTRLTGLVMQSINKMNSSSSTRG